MKFKLVSRFKPSGDQSGAIFSIVKNIQKKVHDQVLMGVTGSGKTFTVANVINEVQKPTLIMTHNKTLAAQIYSEMREFFPENAVEYFVSYYDYYQPEAYLSHSDTYIEKTSSINEEIDRMRHSATRSLLERKDVIIVASVSCIYGIGPIETYSDIVLELKIGTKIDPQKLCRKLIELQYQRNDLNFKRGTFRSGGDIIEVFPSHLADRYWRIDFFGNEIESIYEMEFPSRKKLKSFQNVKVFSNSHHVASKEMLLQAAEEIKSDLQIRLKEFEQLGKIVERQRLEQRILYDIEMMITTGSCSGIENYSRYFSGRNPGEPPPTLVEYFPKDSLLIVDESHVSIPQIRGMYLGDRSRKNNLSEYGFRLPSCMDNRPLKFEEWNKFRSDTIYLSATPAEFEINVSNGYIVEQIIRPTGIVDPECSVRPCENQIDDLMEEIQLTKAKGFRTLVTTLTKKMAEALTEYLSEHGVNVAYMHSDIETLDRIEIIRGLKAGDFDVLVGINLLREGLDIPECGLVAILDADKEGFLRSRTSLIQTIGRAARNVDGHVILYADNITKSMEYALSETERRRKIQIEFNHKHGITPKSITVKSQPKITDTEEPVVDIRRKIADLEKKMNEAAENLLFENAAKYRDEIKKLRK
ncbi:MAG: excinuclease ABC subunit UvrB [Holosporales bacterium]|jgi:excinuclease ABC subunit B|nr:excinuclease ABC subunit UvrB [Holosporales bacterium]